MGFWAGLARGYKDASEAKAQKEELEAKRAERKSDFEYKKGRDTLLDERYLADKAENLRRFELNFKTAADSLAEERAWRESQAEQAQANRETEWKRKDEYDEKAWALTLDKWDFTQEQEKEARIHADKVFNQTIAAFEYGKEQDVLTNLRRDRAETRELANTLYQRERDLVGDQRAKENRDDRLKQFEFQVKRAGVSDEQWQASFDMRVEDQKIARASSLLAMLPPGMVSSLGGDTKTNIKREAVSKEALAVVGSKFQAKFDTLSDEAKESDFFKAAAGDLKVQATLIGFMEAQAEKNNNNIKMEDLPKYFDYLGKTEGRGEAKAKEMLEAIMSGDENVNDADSFIRGMIAFRNVKESEALFMQKGAPVELKDQNDQIKYWETSIVTDAYAGLDRLSPADREEVTDALANVELDDGNKIKGLRTLAKFNFGRDAIAEHNMDVGYINKMYPAETEAAEVPKGGEAEVPKGGEAEVPKGGEAEVIAEEPDPELPEGVTAFESFAEVEQARKEGFSGPASVAGETFKIKPLYPDNEPAGMGTKPIITDEDAMEAELSAMSKFSEEPSGLRGEGPVEKYFGQQAGGLRGTGNSDEQAEGNRPGEKGIDLDKFVDISFKGEGTIEEPMNLAGASSSVVSNKIVNLMDDVPPRTPRKNIKGWMMKEFKRRYKNANIDDAKLEAMIDSLTEFVQTDEG